MADGMSFEEYRARFLVDPSPEPRFPVTGLRGAAVYTDRFDEAVPFYTAALGPPGYVEGEGTRSWALGDAWLTLLNWKGAPSNVELIFELPTVADAERIQKAFVDAGAEGEPPSDQFMIDRIRFCPVSDPFGVKLLFIAKL